jgi:hypothetical protein
MGIFVRKKNKTGMKKLPPLFFIFILLSNNCYSQLWRDFGLRIWSYDTIANKNIKKVFIYTKWGRGKDHSIISNDSTLMAIQYFDNGIKKNEIYYACDKTGCNDTVWYFYDKNRRLTKIDFIHNYAGELKGTILFEYDKSNFNFKRIFINKIDKNTETLFMIRKCDNKNQLVCQIDSCLIDSNKYISRHTIYTYDSLGKLSNTITTTFPYDFPIEGGVREYNLEFQDGLDPQPNHNKGLWYYYNEKDIEPIIKNNLITKEIFYNKLKEIFRIDYYYYE